MTPLSEESLRLQLTRLIIENRNHLNDPTTNEPYDMQGIVDDLVTLILAERQAWGEEVIYAGDIKMNDLSSDAYEAKERIFRYQRQRNTSGRK